jgi:hypothetical protein
MGTCKPHAHAVFASRIDDACNPHRGMHTSEDRGTWVHGLLLVQLVPTKGDGV